MSDTINTIEVDAHMWRARMADGLDTEGKRAFEAWLDADPDHFDAYTEAESFWGRVGQTSVHTAIANAFPQVSFVEQEPAVSPIPASHKASLTDAFNGWLARFLGFVITAAACVTVFFALGGPGLVSSSGQTQVQTFATGIGETRTIALSDRTRIILGASSHMELELTAEERRVRLIEGEGYFDVARNRSRPFVVATDFGSVEVTGTQFDVRLQPASMNVGVGEGSVSVSALQTNTTDASSADLKAGEGVRVTLERGVSEIFEVFPTEFAAWRKGRLIYIRAPLSEVIDDINRYADSRVGFDEGVGDIEFSGTFDANDIEGVLKSIQEGSPVELIDRDGERYLILQ